MHPLTGGNSPLRVAEVLLYARLNDNQFQRRVAQHFLFGEPTDTSKHFMIPRLLAVRLTDPNQFELLHLAHGLNLAERMSVTDAVDRGSDLSRVRRGVHGTGAGRRQKRSARQVGRY